MSARVHLMSADGEDSAIEVPALAARLEAARTALCHPFAAPRMALVASVANAILKQRGVSSFVKHFGFFIRAAALARLSQDFARRLPSKSEARPRGLVFHLPPQNVETVFLYSWTLSYLVGNANVIRLPAGLSAEMRDICILFLQALKNAGDGSQFFLHYPSNSDLGASISRLSDARVVWGGTAKVEAFAGLPLRDGGKSLWFGDRFSFCVMKGEALSGLDDDARQALADRLHNDVFTFDQMACSSPHILYVTGDAKRHAPAADALLATLAQTAQRKNAAPAVGHQIVRMVQGFSDAASGNASHVQWRDEALTSIRATSPERVDRRVGGGFLRVAFLPSLSDLAGLVQAQDQTITHFGFSTEEIATAAACHVGPGVSRYAAVGSALDFDAVWDGYDIPFELTRLVRFG